MLRLADFFMRLEARLSYALIGLVQATGYAGGLDFPIEMRFDGSNRDPDRKSYPARLRVSKCKYPDFSPFSIRRIENAV